MYTLILTTSTKLASISIFKDDLMKANLNINVTKTHSMYLDDELNSLLKWLKISIDDIKNVIISNGPGSFTGCRISIAFVKGIFVNKDVNIYEVNELDILGYQGYNIYKEEVIALIDSNKEKLYCGIYNKERISQYFVSKLDDIISLVKEKGYKLIGDACVNYKSRLNENGIYFDLNDSYLRLNSENMMYMFLENKLKKVNLINLKPFYLEKSQAEKEKS